MLLTIIIATFLVSLVAWLGILFFWRKQFTNKFIKSGISLAAGALLGAVFLNIIPELFDKIDPSKQPQKMLAENDFFSIIILGSIVLFFLIEKYLHWHHCQCSHDEKSSQKKPLGYINLIGDGLHNFIDGSLIASTFMIDYHLGVITTLAIVIHEIPQEIADFTILIHSGFTKTKALVWNFIFALTAVLGGILTYLFAQTIDQLTPILLSIAAGSFLYLAMSDIIPELQKENSARQIFKQLFWLVFGIALIYLGNILFGGHSHS